MQLFEVVSAKLNHAEDEELLSLHDRAHRLWDVLGDERTRRAHRIVRGELERRGLKHLDVSGLDERATASLLLRETGMFLAVWPAYKSAMMAKAKMQGQLDSLFGKLFDSLKRKLKDRGLSDHQGLVKEWAQDALPLYKETLSSGALEAADVAYTSTNAGLGVDAKGLADPVAERIKDKLFTASENTMERISGQVEEKLLQCYQDGIGIDEAARQLRDDVFDGLQNWEAERIARTEIQGAQNYANHHAIVEHADYEQWWTAGDDRVRDSHVEMHGQITRPGDAFSNGLLYPGDPLGDTEEIINCRCYSIPYNMPMGMIPPPGATWFYEEDLVEAMAEVV